MEIIYKGIAYTCEVINGYVFAPPSLAHLSDDASESDDIIPQDERIAYYLNEEEVSLSDDAKLALIGIIAPESLLIIHDITPYQYTTLRGYVTLTCTGANKFQFEGALSNTIHAWLNSNNVNYSIQK
jgi:hypothetical protein